MNSELSKYKHFKAADFFTDENFVQNSLKPTNAQNDVWYQLGEQYPDLVAEMELARTWMLLIKGQLPVSGKMSSNQRWENIQKQIPVYNKTLQKRQIIRKIMRWTAAAAALLVFAFFCYEISQYGVKATRTAFGEQRQFVLPDSSVIKLNSNSRLSYVRNWKTDKPREVWFEGEGIFEVKHTALKNRLRENDYFTVHVGTLSLTVLGTKFNVKDRRGRIEVSLLEGSIRVQGKHVQDVILIPGETFIHDEYANADRIIKKDVDNVLSWTRGELSIDHISLANMIHVIEDNYGYQVQVEDSALLDKRFTGSIPVKGIDDILFVIKHTMNVNIKVKNKIIVIQPN